MGLGGAPNPSAIFRGGEAVDIAVVIAVVMVARLFVFKATINLERGK